jgi:pectinesterase
LEARRVHITGNVRPMLSRRDVLYGIGASAATCAIASPARAAAPDVVVSRVGGRNQMPSVAAALDAARSADRPFHVHVTAGDWREKLTIDVPNLTITGEGAASRIIYGAAAGHRRPEGTRWGTGGSATLTVTAPGVSFDRIAIANDFDFLADQRTGASGGAQAVALALAAGADRTLVRACEIAGYQDTLYVREGRAWFGGCRILGGTDFIFGGATARFDRCEIVSRAVAGDIAGFVAAPSTPAVQPVGLVFTRCRLTREAGLADASVYLGRPWRAGGNMALTGAAAFIDCWMDRHIRREGWAAMGYTAPDGRRTELTPQEARLVEHGSRGPGAGPASATRRAIDKRAADALIAATEFTRMAGPHPTGR